MYTIGNLFNSVLKGHFPAIEKNKTPYRLLCIEYSTAM